MEIGNVTKAATFKNFLHQSYKNTQKLFLWLYFLIIFMRQMLTGDFWGLHKNNNCVFPLRTKLRLVFRDQKLRILGSQNYLLLIKKV